MKDTLAADLAADVLTPASTGDAKPGAPATANGSVPATQGKGPSRAPSKIKQPPYSDWPCPGVSPLPHTNAAAPLQGFPAVYTVFPRQLISWFMDWKPKRSPQDRLVSPSISQTVNSTMQSSCACMRALVCVRLSWPPGVDSKEQALHRETVTPAVHSVLENSLNSLCTGRQPQPRRVLSMQLQLTLCCCVHRAPQCLGRQWCRLALLQAATMYYLSLPTPEVLSLLIPEALSLLTPEALSLLTPEALSLLTSEALSLLTPEALSLLTPEALSLLTPEALSLLTPEAFSLQCSSFSATHTGSSPEVEARLREVMTALNMDTSTDLPLADMLQGPWSPGQPPIGKNRMKDVAQGTKFSLLACDDFLSIIAGPVLLHASNTHLQAVHVVLRDQVLPYLSLQAKRQHLGQGGGPQPKQQGSKPDASSSTALNTLRELPLGFATGGKWSRDSLKSFVNWDKQD
eukprot:1140558-Pelagomonas_calceolata.AAC.7